MSLAMCCFAMRNNMNIVVNNNLHILNLFVTIIQLYNYIIDLHRSYLSYSYRIQKARNAESILIKVIQVAE